MKHGGPLALALALCACSTGPPGWVQVREVDSPLLASVREPAFADEDQRKLYGALVDLIRERGGTVELFLDNVENNHRPIEGKLVGWTARMGTADLKPLASLEVWGQRYGIEKFTDPGEIRNAAEPCRVGHARIMALKLMRQVIVLVASEVTAVKLPGPESTTVCFGSTSRMQGGLGLIRAELELLGRPGAINLTPPGEDRLAYDPDYTYGYMQRVRVTLSLPG